MKKHEYSDVKTFRFGNKTIAQLADLKAYHKSNKAWLEAAIERQWNRIFNPKKDGK
ncbi:MAG: hypothetical protein V4772_08895 [Pseudomonadota bacterium]